MSEAGGEAERICRAAVAAAQAAFGDKSYAVVVVVREIPDGKLQVGSNITSGRPDIVRTLTDATAAVRGSGVQI